MRCKSVLIGLLIVALAGCTQSAITVDGETISKELFEYSLNERIGSHKGMNVNVNIEAVKKAVTDELIAQAVLVKEAKAKNISVTDDEVQQTIDSMRGETSKQEFIENLKKKGLRYNVFQERVKSNMMIAKLMDTLVVEDKVTEEMMNSFYQEKPERYFHPGQVYVKILQMSDEAEAEKVSKELTDGADFDTLADGMGSSGKAFVSNYGWINPKMLPTEDLSVAMETAETDVVKGPFKGKDESSYFFKIRERKASRELTFEEAKIRVKKDLITRMRKELAAHLIEIGRKNAKIEINL